MLQNVLIVCRSGCEQLDLRKAIEHVADVSSLTTVLVKFPRDLVWDFSRWPSDTKGAFFGIPVVSVWKLIWLFGLGRDSE